MFPLYTASLPRAETLTGTSHQNNKDQKAPIAVDDCQSSQLYCLMKASSTHFSGALVPESHHAEPHTL